MLLDGIRVIDWTVFQVGPFASAMLADLGADVIRIEHRERGDLLRGLSPQFGGIDSILGGRQINFEEHNRNKRGIALDLTKPEGVEVLHRLVPKADVFLTNFRPDARKKFRLDYKTLREINPRLIYASATGFGEQGEDAQMPSVDMLAQARSGAMFSAGEEGGPPVYSVPNLGDRGTAMALAFGTVAALFGRERGAPGQEVKVSQLGAMVALQGYYIMPVLTKGRMFQRVSRTEPTNALWNIYQCADDKWVVLCSLERPGEWETFCKAVDRSDLVADPRFAAREDRFNNAKALALILEQMLGAKPRHEWLALFKKHDVLANEVNDYFDLLDDPQVSANNILPEWDHPVWGKTRFPGFAADFSATPASFRTAAPELGQHTEEVLTELCGYSWDEVAELASKKVI